MTSTPRQTPTRRVLTVAPALALGVAVLAGCGGASPSAPGATVANFSTKPSPVVVQVGAAAITGRLYEHWMAIGAATVEMPNPTGPLPPRVAYIPPNFTACIAHLRKGMRDAPPVAALRAECRATYESIRRRILTFLIEGYWLRGEAAERHVSLTPREVHSFFEAERRAHYPTPAAFRRLQEASHQSLADLEFAVKTRMLSSRLLRDFATRHPRERSEQATIAAFNSSIRSRWAPRTSCRPGYVVPYCRQYRLPKATATAKQKPASTASLSRRTARAPTGRTAPA